MTLAVISYLLNGFVCRFLNIFFTSTLWTWPQTRGSWPRPHGPWPRPWRLWLRPWTQRIVLTYIVNSDNILHICHHHQFNNYILPRRIKGMDGCFPNNLVTIVYHGNVGMSFWCSDVLPDANQLGLGKRRWNLATSPAEIEFRLRTIILSEW